MLFFSLRSTFLFFFTFSAGFIFLNFTFPALGQKNTLPIIETEPPAFPSQNSGDNELSNYNPQPLGEGYAVLVDYLNQPEVAAQLEELLAIEIGLASYLARPYLLVEYTQQEGEANQLLTYLSDRGFWPMIVDSRKVTLLAPRVR